MRFNMQGIQSIGIWVDWNVSRLAAEDLGIGAQLPWIAIQASILTSKTNLDKFLNLPTTHFPPHLWNWDRSLSGIHLRDGQAWRLRDGLTPSPGTLCTGCLDSAGVSRLKHLHMASPVRCPQGSRTSLWLRTLVRDFSEKGGGSCRCLKAATRKLVKHHFCSALFIMAIAEMTYI